VNSFVFASKCSPNALHEEFPRFESTIVKYNSNEQMYKNDSEEDVVKRERTLAARFSLSLSLSLLSFSSQTSLFTTRGNEMNKKGKRREN
jgi:hypothetical protein